MPTAEVMSWVKSPPACAPAMIATRSRRAPGSPPERCTCRTPSAAASANTRAQVCVSSSLPRGSSASGFEQYGQPSGQRCVSSAETARLACAYGLAPSRSPEHDDGRALHGDREGLGCGSELGRQVAVDLEADADLDKDRGRPRHGTLREIL